MTINTHNARFQWNKLCHFEQLRLIHSNGHQAHLVTTKTRPVRELDDPTHVCEFDMAVPIQQHVAGLVGTTRSEERTIKSCYSPYKK